MPIAMYLLPVFYSSLIFLGLLTGNVIIEYGYYRRWPLVHPIYYFLFGKMLRHTKEDSKFELSGSPWVLASAFLVVLLFETHTAVFAFSSMLIGDAAAALIGRRYGKIKFSNKKSFEGVGAFILAALVVLFICGWLFHFPSSLYVRGAVGIFMASLVELYGKTIGLDDNFSIPLIIGIVMTLR